MVWRPLNSEFAQVFLLILHNERDQKVRENFIVFLRKNLIGGNLNFLGHFLFDWVWSKLSQTTVNIGYLSRQDMISFVIATGSLNSQDMIKILKQPGHDFSGKRLCDGYSDIM